ncbi:MAG TPA: SDR family NAD(P)-dependent oxidoreductase, partial [Methylophilus sp.]|nr:SDR family NAD(P)-dependent oxidoreductase [Methylophilus sp.]
MQKILVTGGSGYIGSHTCVTLLDAGYDVVVLDNLCNSKLTAISRIETVTGKKVSFLKGDVRDKDFLRSLFDQYRISAVIHFAGLKAVGESVADPLRYYDNNVMGTLNLVEVMAEFSVKTLVFSSS